MLEVELKASLAQISPEKMEEAWNALGFVPVSRLREVDTYYNASDRDFRRTDEALRLRSCTEEEHGTREILLTYKGPKLDRKTSTRTEYEVAVSEEETTGKILEALGYLPVFKVDKRRRELRREQVTLCLDDVVGLGRYLELETLVPDDGDRERAEDLLLGILDGLQVPRTALTRTSYLGLLMKQKEPE